MNAAALRAMEAVISPGSVPALRKLLVMLTLRRATGASSCGTKDLSIAASELEVPSSLAGVGCFVLLSEIAEVAKGPTGIKGAKPGPYPLVVTAEDRGTCDHYDFEGEAVLVPMVSSTGHGDASLKRIHYQEGRFAVGSILAAIQVRDPGNYSPRFLYEYLSSFKDELLVARMSGTANVSLTVKKIAAVPVPVIRIADQRRLHDLMRLCDALEAKGRLEAQQHARLLETLLGTLTDSTTPEELAANWQRVAEHFDLLLDRPEAVDVLEQTVLRLAVRGLLVERDQYGTPECPSEGAVRSAVPYGWTRRQFGDVVNMLNGYAFKSDWFRASGIRLVRNVNVSHGQLDWSQSAFVSTDLAEEFSQFSLIAGDVVLSLDRPIISTGLKLAVIRTIDLPCLLLQRVARLTPDPKALSTRYMELWLSSDRFLNAIDPGRSNGVPHISTKQVAALEIDLPPVDEQARIVARVTELRRFCGDLRQRLVASQATQSRLAEALVAAATA